MFGRATITLGIGPHSSCFYGRPEYIADADIILLPCGFFCLLFSSPNLSGRTLDVYHTSTHSAALVRI